MKTEISTKHLLELINPSKDGVFYKGQKIKVNFKELKKIVEQPKKYEVYKYAGDYISDFHKNLALYIINSDEPSCIHIDLNNPNIFEENKGLFEYIKNIYTQQNKSYISLNEEGDNLILIKGKNLQPLSAEQTFPDAYDMHFVTAATALSENEQSHIKTKDQITWKPINSDMYGDINYVLGKVNELFRSLRHANQEKYNELFDSLAKKINPTLLNSDEFKFALLDMEHPVLNEFLIERFNENKNDTYFIDFSLPIFQEKILNQIKNNKFSLLAVGFNLFLSRNKYSSKKSSTRFDNIMNFKFLLNQPETINYLLNSKYSSTSTFDGPDDSFSMVSVYPYLEEEQKTDPKIAGKYIELAIKKSGDGTSYMSENLIEKLKPKVFEHANILASVIKYVDFPKFKNSLKQKNVDISLLSDKNFIISVASQIPSWRLAKIISSCFAKEDIDKEFIHSLVKQKYHFFEQLDNSNNKLLWPFRNDLDIIKSAVEGGLPLKDIGKNTVKQFLLENHNDELERQKISYMISTRALYDLSYELSVKGEELERLKRKFLKPEYVFYKNDDYYYHSSHRTNVLSNIKTVEQTVEILDKIKNQNFNYEFLSDLFYTSLPPLLRKEKIIVSKLLDLGAIRYKSLDESLAYNCDIVIRCLENHPESLKDVPHELFTNSKFALKFARLLDYNKFPQANIPSFVTKFFENQEISKNYETSLQEHLFYTNLGAELDKPRNESAKRRVAKI